MRPLLLLCFLLPACATADSKWPDLARRSGEAGVERCRVAGGGASDGCAVPATAAPTPAPVPAAPATTVAINPVATARLAEAERDLATLKTRWQQQRKTTEAAVAAARDTKPSSPAWATAQLELTRLEQIGAQLVDMRSRLDAIAGDLAANAARGDVATGSTAAVGQAITEVEALRAEHKTVFDAANTALPR